MREDSRVLEIYIDFMVTQMKELEQLCLQEKELIQKMNILNKRKNLETIHQNYQEYLKIISTEWVKIYISSSHYSEAMNQFSLLSARKSPFALTLPQKCVEQFFFELYRAVSFQVSYLEKEKNYKAYYSDFLDSFVFSSVKVVMRYLFNITLESMKSHAVNVDETKKQAFVIENQKLLPDLSIQYTKGEILTDIRIEKIFVDMEEHQKKEHEEYVNGVSNGRIKVCLATYKAEYELKAGLERSSSQIMASLICGSTIYYDTLPVLLDLQFDKLLEIAGAINAHAERIKLAENELIELKERNALYLGIATGCAYLNSKPFAPAFLQEMFLCHDVMPTDIPSRVMDYIGKDFSEDDTAKIEEIISRMLSSFTSSVMYPKSDENLPRVLVALMVAYKLGYNSYFRIKTILPGNTYEQDQLILNRKFPKNSYQRNNTKNTETTVATTNQKILTDQQTQSIEEDSLQRHNVQGNKYWLDEKGNVKCPGDACPVDCDLDCPIYAQTLALEKYSNNNYKEALVLLSKAVAKEPSFADAWNNMAACFGQMGYHRNAFTAYKTSYEFQQKPNPLYGMAVAKKNMKDYSSAEQYINEYIEKFGLDERISALRAELASSESAMRTDTISKPETYASKPEQTTDRPTTQTHTLSHSMAETHTLRHL